MPWALSALAVGGSRHFDLIQRLAILPTLEKLGTAGRIETRKGIIVGDGTKEVRELRGQRYFSAEQFPTDVFIQMNASLAPSVAEIRVDAGHGIRDLRSVQKSATPLETELCNRN